jgi:hypothetical protein
MRRRMTACVVIGSFTLASCAQQNGQPSTQGQTVAEGAGIGVLAGAALGAVLGGGRGAAYGAVAGGLLGGATGIYVAQQKTKYASIEQRIAGERQIAAQATATAQSQTAASATQLAVADQELRELTATKVSTATARDRAGAMLVNLQNQRTELESQKKDLETRYRNQQDFIAETEKEVGTNDPQKTAQLAEWKAEMPGMQQAVTAMTTQISDISEMETRVERVKATCC